MLGPCILPFANCPYRQTDGYCGDLGTCPFNSDAGCFGVKRKRSMIARALDLENRTMFGSLDVKTYRKNTSAGRFLRIFIGEKHLCTLQWMEPVLPGGDSRWWLDANGGKDFQAVGNNELDAVEDVLRIFGYKKQVGL